MSSVHYTPLMGYLSPCPLCGHRRQNLLRNNPDGSFTPTTGCYPCQMDDARLGFMVRAWGDLQKTWSEGEHQNLDMAHWVFKEKEPSRYASGKSRSSRRSMKVMRVGRHPDWGCQAVTAFTFAAKGKALRAEYQFKLEDFIQRFKPVQL